MSGTRLLAAQSQFGLSRNPFAIIAIVILATFAILAIAAPCTPLQSPTLLDPLQRLEPPSSAHLLGTDMLGRDIFSRLVYGARASLVVALACAVVSISAGVLLGLAASYARSLDAVVMRIMDALMAIPGILLAIALAALNRGTLPPLVLVVLAISIPETPRVVRLIRSVVLSVREEPFVEAAIAVGTSRPVILFRHILPSAVPAVIVQATYICAAAMLSESILSFLGAGMPPEIPTWGNMIADGRAVFSLSPVIILAPGAALAITILAVNILGDALRDRLDPKLAGRT